MKHDFLAASAQGASGNDVAFRGLLLVERLRERLGEMLTEIRDPFGILRELLIGEAPPGGQGAVLRLCGFVHLLHATGAHLYGLSEVVFVAARSGVILVARLREGGESAEWVVPALLVARLCSIAAYLFAWALCGFRRSLVRPLCVVLCRMASSALGFRWRRFAPLVLALAIDLLLNRTLSMASLAYGVAVAGAILSLPERGTILASHFRMAIGSWCLAGLVEAWSEGWVSLATPVLSLVTLPLYGSLIYPALLLGAALAASGWSLAAEHLFHAVAASSGPLLIELARWTLRAPSLWLLSRAELVGGALVALVSGVLLRAFPQRTLVHATAALALLCAHPLWASLLAHAPSPEVEVAQLDVGQGDSAWIRAPLYGTGLIDAGSAHRVGEMAWLSLIGRRRITRIDWIALTHLDEDHSGGVETLARLIKIGCVSTSRAEIESERGQRYAERLRELGVAFGPLDEPCIPIPHRDPGIARSAKNGNMSAFVVPLSPGGIFLDAGDAESTDEEQIGVWFADLAAHVPPGPRILKISHHGSKTSSSPRFLEEVRPSEAWISVGLGNPYGHPHPTVLARLAELHIPIRRTDQEGTIMPK